MTETIKDELDRLEEMCETFESKLFLGRIVVKDTDYMMSKDELMKKTPLQIYGECYEWAQYLTGLQKEIGKQNARHNWFEHNLETLLNKENINYKGFSFAERKAEAYNRNSAAQVLARRKEQFKMEVDRLWSIVKRIEYQIDMAKNIAYAKQAEERNVTRE